MEVDRSQKVHQRLAARHVAKVGEGTGGAAANWVMIEVAGLGFGIANQ